MPGIAESDVSYAEVNFKTLSAPRVRTDRDGLNSTYSELNFRKEEPRIDEDEDVPDSGAATSGCLQRLSRAQKQEAKQNIGNRTCLLCLVTFTLGAIVAGLPIYVSQIRQSKVTSVRNYHELNSSLQSKLSTLNSNLSVLEGMHSDLRYQFIEMETKYRSVKETKAQICELLSSRTEQTCPKDWVTNTDRCYFVSTFAKSFPRAMQECSNRDSRLLEVNSRVEASFVSRSIVHRNLAYWIGQCENGDDAYGLLYRVSFGRSSCNECKLERSSDYCLHDKHHFICEKSAPCCPDFPEKIRVVCQQPGEPT